MLSKSITRFYVLVLFLSIMSATRAQVPLVVATGKPVADSTRTDAFLEEMLEQYPQYFDTVLANRKVQNIQVIYTKIDRGANGIAALKHFYFNVNARNYFDPASAAGLPAAMLTLQKMGELKQKGIDRNTTMLTEKAYSGQTAVYNDPATPDGKPSIARYLKKMLLISDADAYNRLYEFLGQQYINDQLHQKGYTNAQIIQRLDVDLTEEENRHTNPVTFLAPGNKILYQQQAQYNTMAFVKRNDSLGKEDFPVKNRISLEDLHHMLVSLVFPNKVTSSQRFSLSDEERKYILKYMSQLPTESINPPYSEDTATYHPAYNKYLMYGAGRDTLARNIRIFNVAGESEGEIIDVAYIVDFDKKIEFFLSAVINSGNDGSLQNGNYQNKGLTFMKQLGQVMYSYEAKREKKIAPDLSDVKFEYDGR